MRVPGCPRPHHSIPRNTTMRVLRKPSRSRYSSEVEAYHNEHMRIDSTATAAAACGQCHNLEKIHSHVSHNAGAGLGLTGIGASASFTQDKGDKVTVNGTFGQGLVVHSSITYNPTPGPHVIVAGSKNRGVTLSGGGTETYSAAADKTRTGG